MDGSSSRYLWTRQWPARFGWRRAIDYLKATGSARTNRWCVCFFSESCEPLEGESCGLDTAYVCEVTLDEDGSAGSIVVLYEDARVGTELRDIVDDDCALLSLRLVVLTEWEPKHAAQLANALMLSVAIRGCSRGLHMSRELGRIKGARHRILPIAANAWVRQWSKPPSPTRHIDGASPT